MKKRLIELVHQLAFSLPLGFLGLVVLSSIFLFLNGDIGKWEAWCRMLKFMFIWFGMPALIIPFLEFIYPEKSSNSYSYSSAGFYYGGAVLSSWFKSILIGYILAFILLHLYFRKVAE